MKTAWEEEAGDTSLSKYVQEKVAEARPDGNDNNIESDESSKQIKELEAEIERLEKQLQEQEQNQHKQDTHIKSDEGDN